jgi:cobalt-zinc-cadmium efflux system outer membrane protein
MWLKIVLVAVMLTAGCATFHRAPIDPSQTASDFESRSFDNAGLKKYIEQNLHSEIVPWPPKSWGLDMLTFAAFFYNPDLETAIARWGVAEAGVITAGERPNPTATFVPQYVTNLSGSTSPWVLNFSLYVPIETAGKRGYRISRARHLSKAAYFDVASAAWGVRSRLRSSLVGLYINRRIVSVLRSRIKIQEEVVRLMEKRLSAGEISEPEMMTSRLLLDRMRLALSEADSSVSQSRADVATALGMPAGALNEIGLSHDFIRKLPENLPPRDARRQALLNRADILSMLSEYDAAQSALQLEIAKQYPDVNLGPGYEFDQGENKWALGVSISLPVFNRNEGPIAEADARRKEVAARFIALQATVIGELDRALALYSKAAASLKAADSLIGTRQQKEQSLQKRFNLGEIDRLALLNGREELYSADLLRVKAINSLNSALGMIEDAMQRPLNNAGPFIREIKQMKRSDNG